ncbi:membrane-bound O-acyltransferase family protein [Pseudoroseomonas deserti]|uniref:Probable alginate O-acetylase AlgI n=1 Tax=Teichococcus deserti TaxID=1817963 RepID=A0A1V2H289_9PROT|nr:MBOAT family protein [Pseudoroseomonas deserti]ONG53104.1 membrane-bound O-acyltransferase family protein [Pseudoroseomonas deserti]
MIFASFEFLCLFLPLFFAVYFLTPKRWRNFPVLVLSWGFYAWWRVDFLALLLGVTVFTFLVARAMEKAGAQGPAAKRWMQFGLVGNLATLGYFKYANFGVDSFNMLLEGLGLGRMGWTEIALPIGLSFYVLQSVSYLVDVRRGTVPVSHSFIGYATYKAIFSQLIAGPIVRYAEIKNELVVRQYSWAQFGMGARRFMIGFAMKVILADTISPMVDSVFHLPAPTLVDAWAGALAYTLQLFFDFAGYSAMAIGLALMIGFRFPENFDNPYLSGSIQAFWQRWHMTLGRFLRDYLYIPLGGSRKGQTRTSVNLFLTMLIGGFWHGANWTFVFWGAWQGALLVAHRHWRMGHAAMPWILGHAITFLAVLLGWVIFRAPDLHSAGRMYGGMLGLHGTGLSDELAWQVTPDQWICILVGIVFVYLPLLRGRLPFLKPAAELSPFWRLPWTAAPLLAFLLGIVLLYSRAAVPFLYFQF